MINFHAKQPWKRPPPGWKVNNVLYTRLLALAHRTGCEELIMQVKALSKASRSDIVIIMEVVAQAAKGIINPDLLNLQQMIKEYHVNENETENNINETESNSGKITEKISV